MTTIGTFNSTHGKYSKEILDPLYNHVISHEYHFESCLHFLRLVSFQFRTSVHEQIFLPQVMRVLGMMVGRMNKDTSNRDYELGACVVPQEFLLNEQVVLLSQIQDCLDRCDFEKFWVLRKEIDVLDGEFDQRCTEFILEAIGKTFSRIDKDVFVKMTKIQDFDSLANSEKFTIEDDVVIVTNSENGHKKESRPSIHRF